MGRDQHQHCQFQLAAGLQLLVRPAGHLHQRVALCLVGRAAGQVADRLPARDDRKGAGVAGVAGRAGQTFSIQLAGLTRFTRRLRASALRSCGGPEGRNTR